MWASKLKIDTTLSDLVTRNSKSFFKILDINADFLKEPPESWPDHEGYLHAEEIASSLKVTNEAAERGVALVKEFRHRNDKNFQDLLLVVDLHRKLFE